MTAGVRAAATAAHRVRRRARLFLLLAGARAVACAPRFVRRACSSYRKVATSRLLRVTAPCRGGVVGCVFRASVGAGGFAESGRDRVFLFLHTQPTY